MADERSERKAFICSEGVFELFPDGSVVQVSGNPVDPARTILKKLYAEQIHHEPLRFIRG